MDVIAEDWRQSVELLAPGSVIFLDDYCDHPRIPGEYGANTLAEQLAGSVDWKVEVLPVVDDGKNNTGIPVVRVERRKARAAPIGSR